MPRRRRRHPVAQILGLGTIIVFALAMVAALGLRAPVSGSVVALPFMRAAALTAGASPNAFGASGNVKLRVALPGEHVDIPLEVGSDPSALSYTWVGLADTFAVTEAKPLGAGFEVPTRSGLYRLAVVRGHERRIVAEPTVAVLVPFAEKRGSWLRGYRIGMYIAERLEGREDKPAGFLEVRQGDDTLAISRHLHLSDFLTHDTVQRDIWPKYVALNPVLLDKVELVLGKIGARSRLTSTDSSELDVALDVHSGFRTPLYNRKVRWSARDSRHQYGDALDVAIDADGDGRVTLRDELMVARAVDEVEREHPEMVGGLGLYLSRRYRTPYVHIDARGRRSRWRG